MKRWIAAVFVLTAIATGFAVWVGANEHAAGSKAFNWELFAAVGTATGTTLLATLTGTLAVVTWSDVKASRRIAEEAAAERVARERPILLLEHMNLGCSSAVVSIHLWIRNAGAGTAIRGRLEIGFAPDGAQSPTAAPTTWRA